MWNMDETGWALPDYGFGQKGKVCKRGKKRKQRITVAFFVSSTGVKEKPIVIRKSANPRCLKCFDRNACLYSTTIRRLQKAAWMTGEIMQSILTKLNQEQPLNIVVAG